MSVTVDRLDTAATSGPTGARRFVAGVLTVARLELRQRVRSSRWVIVLVVWTALLALLTAMIRWSVQRTYGVLDGSDGSFDTAHAQAGRMVFGIVVFLVLSLGMLVAPALSATSVNGDRAAGVLATLQTTLLTPVQIVLGKLAASWTVALALLGCALPFVLWAYAEGGTPVSRLLAVLLLLAVVLLVVCAIGLGWSAVAARTSTSSLLTYVSVAFLSVGLPLLFALTAPLVSTTEIVNVRQMQFDDSGNGTGQCLTTRQETQVFHSERSWWLLAPSPYVVLADASPRLPAGSDTNDPLSAIRTGVREARLGGETTQDWCGDQQPALESARAAQRERLGITWPYGLGFLLAAGSGFTVVAVRRLRAPARVLPRGTRVA